MKVPTPIPLTTAAAMVSGSGSSEDKPHRPTPASSSPSAATRPGRWKAPRVMMRSAITPTPRLRLATSSPAVDAFQS